MKKSTPTYEPNELERPGGDPATRVIVRERGPHWRAYTASFRYV